MIVRINQEKVKELSKIARMNLKMCKYEIYIKFIY